MSQEEGLLRVAGEWALLAFAVVCAVDLAAVFDASVVLGKGSRDIYDHLALLDQWSIQVDEWAFPTGGSLVAPDLWGMMIAAPWMGLGRGVAYDLSILLQDIVL